MVLKSLFDHQEADLQQMVPLIADNARLNQDKLLKQQIEALKLKPQPEMSARIDKQLSSRDRDVLDKLHPTVKNLSKVEAAKINEGLLKQFSDQNLSAYSKLVDGFLKSALR